VRRIRLGSTLALLGLAVVLSACSGENSASLPKPKPGFCEAAQRYDKRIERGASIPEQITILEKLVRNAPKDVAADANFFLDTMRKGEHATEAQRKKLQAEPAFQRAVDHVDRRAINGCDFFAQTPGQGGM